MAILRRIVRDNSGPGRLIHELSFISVFFSFLALVLLGLLMFLRPEGSVARNSGRFS